MCIETGYRVKGTGYSAGFLGEAGEFRIARAGRLMELPGGVLMETDGAQLMLGIVGQ
jgi:hypothetical protein